MELNDDSPLHRRLCVEIDTDSVYALVVPDSTALVSDFISVRLDPTAPSRGKALEEAVYATDALTADYRGCEVLFRNDSFTPVPEVVDPEAAADIARAITLADDEETVMVDRPVAGCRIVWTVDASLLNFVRRTFCNPRLGHVLTPLLEWFAARACKSAAPKVFVNMHSGAGAEVDIAFFDGEGALRGLVSRMAPGPVDAMYFAVAGARKFIGEDDDTQYLVCGDAGRRDALVGELRKYVPNVMPLLIPVPSLRNDSNLTVAPLPLSLLTICE